MLESRESRKSRGWSERGSRSSGSRSSGSGGGGGDGVKKQNKKISAAPAAPVAPSSWRQLSGEDGHMQIALHVAAQTPNPSWESVQSTVRLLHQVSSLYRAGRLSLREKHTMKDLIVAGEITTTVAFLRDV